MSPSTSAVPPSTSTSPLSTTRAPARCDGTWPSKFDKDKDFISLHYDCAADTDDLESCVADRALLEASFGTAWLSDERVIPVVGTYGTNGGYNQGGCEAVAQATWGGASGWLQAADRTRPLEEVRRESAAIVVLRWKNAINAGGQIYVKEGGQSDFTKMMVEMLEEWQEGSGKCVHVVQHSDWNTGTTSPGVIAYLQGKTDYVGAETKGHGPVADGNAYLQRPPLHWLVDECETIARNQPESNVDCSGVVNNRQGPWPRTEEFEAAAKGSWLGCAWEVAIKGCCHYGDVDFSDTHELAYILRLSQVTGQPSVTAETFLEDYIRAPQLPAITCDAPITRPGMPHQPCLLSEWSDWGDCSCGLRSRGRTIQQFPFGNFPKCEGTHESEECNSPPCLWEKVGDGACRFNNDDGSVGSTVCHESSGLDDCKDTCRSTEGCSAVEYRGCCELHMEEPTHVLEGANGVCWIMKHN